MTDQSKAEELREKIAAPICEPCLTYFCAHWDKLPKRRLEDCKELRDWADQILAFTDAYYKEKYAGYVKLAEDQSLPSLDKEREGLYIYSVIGLCDMTQQDMLKVVDGKAFRKVKLEE